MINIANFLIITIKNFSFLSIFSLLISIIYVLFAAFPVYGISDEQIKLFDLGINYYDLEDENKSSCSVGTAVAIDEGAETRIANVLGQPALDVIKSKVEENVSFYEKAARDADIPWELIAVIHYNETGLGRGNPDNGQGVYQFVNGDGGPYPTGPVSDEEFQRQTNFMATRLTEDYQNRNYDENKDGLSYSETKPAVVKDTLFSYNGRASVYEEQAIRLGFSANEGYEGSPYVMNFADDARDPKISPTTWGQVKRDFGPIEYPANHSHVGAWLLYAYLSGENLEGIGSCSNGEITGETAEKVVLIAEREFETGANEADKSYLKYTMGRYENWCADFVSWVYNEAGLPLGGNEGWQIPAVATMLDYAKNRNEFHPKGSSYIPKPGDIAIYKENQPPNRSHVNIVISYNQQNNTFEHIGGNEGDAIKRGEHSMSAIDLTGFWTPNYQGSGEH